MTRQGIAPTEFSESVSHWELDEEARDHGNIFRSLADASGYQMAPRPCLRFGFATWATSTITPAVLILVAPLVAEVSLEFAVLVVFVASEGILATRSSCIPVSLLSDVLPTNAPEDS